jgi:AhpD family alkylhydroperoxidase
MTNSFPEYYEQFRQRMTDLNRAIPDTMAGFRKLHSSAMLSDGALDRKTKELIAVAIGISVRCDGCIASHVRTALRAGASREEILETIGVAIFMGGGPSTVYGAEALQALNQFESVTAPA